ncbi:MAG: hypothetical protein AAF609_17180 [Cyanobacteria bacterium P01_C01_bin.120]|mgnify:CR=1 FL=1
MKYFFLSEGWTTGRIWEFGGLWDEFAWQRKPQIQKLSLSIVENGESLWLYQVEDAVLMVEVRPMAESSRAIGQVVLKRLMSAEQVLDRLCVVDDVNTVSDRNGLASTAIDPLS